MAAAQSQTSRLFTRNLAAYSDKELDKYLETNGRLIDVEDYENLVEHTVLIQRLLTRARVHGMAESCLIDPEDLRARLEGISADREALPRPPSPASTEDLGEEEYYRLDLEEQTEYYDTLVKEGGRPSHPVSLGRDITENPGEYREILSYWQSGENDWMVFESQMGRWKDFRKWQRSNREDGRFVKYVEEVKQALAEHGFTRSFQLDRDLERQDKLMTWIEYLDYEYWWYDIDMRFVNRQQPQYDKAWKELLDSQVLRPFETEEFICNINSAFQHAAERERAEKAVETAKSAVLLAQNATRDTHSSGPSEPDTQERLAAAKSKLDAAMESLESIKRRNDLVYEFMNKIKKRHIKIGRLSKSYVVAKDDAERRSILLRWILQQIPLIELELGQSKVSENDADRQDKRKRNPADDLNQERVSKRRKKDGGINALSNHRTQISKAPTASQDSSSTQLQPQAAGHEEPRKRNCDDATDGELAPKRSKDGGQISNAPEPISIAESLSIQLDRSKPDSSITQVPQMPRRSRRIAGHLPEFGMLKQGKPAPLYILPSRYPPSSHRPNPSNPRSRRSSKKSAAVKGANAQGVSKSRGEETNRSRRPKKPTR